MRQDIIAKLSFNLNLVGSWDSLIPTWSSHPPTPTPENWFSGRFPTQLQLKLPLNLTELGTAQPQLVGTYFLIFIATWSPLYIISIPPQCITAHVSITSTLPYQCIVHYWLHHNFHSSAGCLGVASVWVGVNTAVVTKVGKYNSCKKNTLLLIVGFLALKTSGFFCEFMAAQHWAAFYWPSALWFN